MKNGVNFSLSILVSSSMYDNSFSSQRLKQVEGNRHVYIIDGKIWEVKEGSYSKERFYVFIGNESLDPMIVESVADINSVLDSVQVKRLDDMPVTDAMNLIPERILPLFVAVPIDFRKRFEENIVTAIQDIAGIPIAPQGRLFSSKKHYNACLYDYDEDIQEVSVNEATGEEIVNHYTNKLFMKDEIVISTGSEVEMKDYCNPNYRPEHPEKKRFLHIDQSISGDSTGLACTYLDDVERNTDGTLKKKIKVDWIIRVVPPKPPHKIDIKKVRGIITFLSNTYGIEWGMITYDTYASQEAIQELDKDGFPCAFQSVDRTDEAYLNLVDYIYNNQISFPYHPTFEKELFNLVHFRQRRKVDHPADGSKDVSDSVAGSLMNCVSSDDAYSVLRENDIDYYVEGISPDSNVDEIDVLLSNI